MRAAIYGLLLSGVLSIAVVSPATGASQVPSPGAPTILLDFVVKDAKGRPVVGLELSEVAVFQDNVRQRITELRAHGERGRYELGYVPLSGRTGGATLKILRPGARVRGANGPQVSMRVLEPVSPLEAELTQLLDTLPDTHDFPIHVDALRYEEVSAGIHYALVADVELPKMTSGHRPVRYQVLSRVRNAEGKIVQRQVAQGSFTLSPDPQAPRQRLVWTGKAVLSPGRYTLEIVVRNENLEASARSLTFEARPYGSGPRVSSVALLLPNGARRLDETPEADDPFRLEGRPLMPALALRAAGGLGAQVDFIANAYPDAANSAPVTVRAELLRSGEVLASQPLSLPPADERGALRCAGALPIGKLQSGEYQLRIVAGQGDARAQEEATFAVELRPRVALQTWPKLDRPELREIAGMRNDEEAIARLKRLDQADAKGDPEVLYLLSAVYLRIRAYADAESTARRAAELTKDPAALAEIDFALARALFDGEKEGVNPRSERLRAAEAALRQAIELSAGRVETFHLHLAMVLLRLERGDEARAVLADILERPGLPEPIATQARKLRQSPRCATAVCLPQFSFVTPAGEHRTSEDLRGKVVLLSFWATWNNTSLVALSEIKRLQTRYVSDPFVLIGVSGDHDRDAMEAYLAKNQITWPQLSQDEAARITKSLGVPGVPVEFVFDHEGVAIGKSGGWGGSQYLDLLALTDGAVKKARKAAKAQPAAVRR
jgi:tetratricopeptide (TPR) repeat protein